jgi:hypothetical protein
VLDDNIQTLLQSGANVKLDVIQELIELRDASDSEWERLTLHKAIQEIFKLRAKVEAFAWQLEENSKYKGLL